LRLADSLTQRAHRPLNSRRDRVEKLLLLNVRQGSERSYGIVDRLKATEPLITRVATGLKQ
jgi:hypothetical protein